MNPGEQPSNLQKSTESASREGSNQNWTDLNQAEIDDLITKANQGKLSFTELNSGAYQTAVALQDLEQPDQKTKYIFKVVKPTGPGAIAIHMSINRSDLKNRATAVDPALLHSSILTVDPENKADMVLGLRAIELALQHQKHQEFLGEHVLPKQFALIELPDGKYLVEVEVNLNESSSLYEPGVNQVITWQFQNFSPAPAEGNAEQEKINQYWDTELALEATDFIEKLLAMSEAGYSLDTVNLQNGSNLLLILENGKKHIVTPDTNSWEVNPEKVASAVNRTLQTDQEKPESMTFSGVKNYSAETDTLSLVLNFSGSLLAAVELGLIDQSLELQSRISKILAKLDTQAEPDQAGKAALENEMQQLLDAENTIYARDPDLVDEANDTEITRLFIEKKTLQAKLQFFDKKAEVVEVLQQIEAALAA